uniref:Uncharacterized protein n=1 Tax=Photinus pyralis TaxID=7054 RepID=A0A1Y1NB97_PHOPY
MQIMLDGFIAEQSSAKSDAQSWNLTTATGDKSGPRCRSRVNVQCAQGTCRYIQTQGRDLDSSRATGLDWIAAKMSPGSRNSGVVTLRFPDFPGFALPPL